MRSHYFIAPEFFQLVGDMRKAYDDHFYENHRSFSPEKRIWDYMHKPGQYTYLKTIPERVIPLQLMNLFLTMLQNWSFEVLGTKNISRPVLALYFNAFNESLHYNTGSQGWTYEFSLTPCANRRFGGGDLMIWKEVDYWESDNMTLATGGTAFFDAITPVYNQLVVFDDRVKHAISTLEGQMEPENGRLVLQGYIPYGNIYCNGYLNEDQVQAVLAEALPHLAQNLTQFGHAYHGPLCLKMGVSAQGEVEQMKVVNDRILRTAEESLRPDFLTQAILVFCQSLKFPKALNGTVVTLTLLINMGDGSQVTHVKLLEGKPSKFLEEALLNQSSRPESKPEPAKEAAAGWVRPRPAKAPVKQSV